MINKKVILRYGISVLTIVIGTFLMGIAFSVFLSPNNISPTGFSGIASLISNYAATQGVTINASLLYMGMNLILFLIAFKSMGKEFIVLSVTGVLSFSLCMYLCEFIKLDVGSDLLLCALYGGIFMGAGAGLVIRSGGSTGGGDTIACMLKKSNAKITQGQVIVAIDMVIIAVSSFIYGINYGLYALVTCVIMGYVCDIVINGVKAARAFYIITDKSEELGAQIMKTVERGVTKIAVTGMYLGEAHNMLLCICSRSQVAALKRAVKDIDPKAFMYSVNVSEALGVGFDPLEKQVTKPESKQIVNKTEVNKAETVQFKTAQADLTATANGVKKPKKQTVSKAKTTKK